MAATNESLFALYEGLIALAWADGRLDHNERVVLEGIFARHQGLAPEQRRTLKEEVSSPKLLAEIWPRITDPLHRARLLDLADYIFKSDGHKDEMEEQLYRAKLAKHLGTLDMTALEKELGDLQAEQMFSDKSERQANREYARQFGLFAYIKRIAALDTEQSVA